MRTTLVLARYQLRVLLRTPGYWATALVLSTLGILVFGLFLTDPTGPRIGIIDDAGTEAAAAFIDAAEGLDRVNVRVGDRDDQVSRLRDGERWAVVMLPQGFGEAGSLSGVEVWTGDPGEFTSFTGAGVIAQLLAEAAGETGTGGIEVVEEPFSGGEPLRFIDVVVPGQVGLSLMFGNLFAAATLGNWRQQGILRRIAVSRARPSHLLASQVMVYGLVSAAQATILLSLGSLLFGVSIEGSIPLLAATVAAGVVTFLTIWYTLTALIRSPIAANAIASLFAFVMIFAGGSYIPIENPPIFLRPVVYAAPLKYLNDALRAVINDGAGVNGIALELSVLAAITVVLFFVSTRAFRWTAQD